MPWIIASDIHLDPGKVYTPKEGRDANGDPVLPQPMYCVRAATQEEYLAQGGGHRVMPRFPYYYEMSTD